MLATPSKKQEYEVMQFQEVRLLRLLSVSSQLHDEFLSSITSWINWLKCYKQRTLKRRNAVNYYLKAAIKKAASAKSRLNKGLMKTWRATMIEDLFCRFLCRVLNGYFFCENQQPLPIYSNIRSFLWSSCLL